MLNCNKCLLDLPEEDFHKHPSKKRGYRYSCKKCIKLYFEKYYDNPTEKKKASQKRKKYRDERRDLLIRSKDFPCKDCGIKYHYCVMDFDHVNEKKFGISGYRGSLWEIKNEISKCELVCANCHRLRTYKRLNK